MNYVFQGPMRLLGADFIPYVGKRLGIVSRAVENGKPTLYVGHFGIPEVIGDGLRIVDNKTLTWPQIVDFRTCPGFYLDAHQRIFIES